MLDLRAEIQADSQTGKSIRHFLNKKACPLNSIAKKLLCCGINIRRPVFHISQGSVTKLAMLTGTAVMEHIDNRLGLSQDTHIAVYIRKLAAKMQERVTGFVKDWQGDEALEIMGKIASLRNQD